MIKYAIKRILLMFVTLFVIMTICFVLIKLLPLPAVKEMGRDINLILAKREQMGYNKPIMVQYYLFWKNIILGWDWGVGEQMYEAMSVWDILMQKLPYTIMVNLYSILLAIPLGLGFDGSALIAVRSEREAGPIEIAVTATGFPAAILTVESK